MKLSELYFGDLEAFDEAKNETDFFSKTFVVPLSLSMQSLRNNRRFIVVGRKGAGKTAVQMRLASELEQSGYFTLFFRFAEDLRADDYSEISKTQSHISLADVANPKQLFLHYDFRDVWERTFFNRIGNLLLEAGYQNKFTRFVSPAHSPLQNIFAGLTRSLSIKLSTDAGAIAAEVGVDLSKLEKPDEISLKEFNRVARRLFVESCAQYRMYFFIDELVFSKLDALEDEIRIRAAMVRDIVKTCRELNNFANQNDLDFHFICTLRPEIRNLINDFDSEIGKVVDGRDVALTWYIDGEDGTSLLEKVFNLKVAHSVDGLSQTPLDVSQFVDRSVTFGKHKMTVSEFLKTNTWGRPRDVVRLLLAIAKMNPNSKRIGEQQVKASLDEYSRASAKELIDELSVVHGKAILHALRKGITKKTYDDADELLKALPIPNVNEERFLTELFELGLIGGFQPETGNYFWAHRGESFLHPQMKIRIHPALWNEFGIRGYD
ncbi:hypothetical protein NBRC116590_26150 [Pelagimonas sp. KU-00592-HH]|uniref:P-loop ATPase, Sll1717 family n=1 Tax=Pelagimonas sp. KU-00592-HH TaxID=3127651 RepID=UPI003103CE23